MAGKNYSNLGKLIDNLTAPCENSVKNPQLRMVYWDNIYEKTIALKLPSLIKHSYVLTQYPTMFLPMK